MYLLVTLHVPAHRVSHKVDYLGGSRLAVAATSLVLVATWGGTRVRLGLGADHRARRATAGAGVAFVVTETRAVEPVLPLHVYRDRNFSVSTGMSFLVGLAMFGAGTFLPLFQQTVQGASPTESGLVLPPMMSASRSSRWWRAR